MRKWQEILERTLEELECEMKLLNTTKMETETVLQRLEDPLEKAHHCQITRDNRLGKDLVKDAVQDNISKVRMP